MMKEVLSNRRLKIMVDIASNFEYDIKTPLV